LRKQTASSQRNLFYVILRLVEKVIVGVLTCSNFSTIITNYETEQDDLPGQRSSHVARI
jgi:hypothetical protein